MGWYQKLIDWLYDKNEEMDDKLALHGFYTKDYLSGKEEKIKEIKEPEPKPEEVKMEEINPTEIKIEEPKLIEAPVEPKRKQGRPPGAKNKHKRSDKGKKRIKEIKEVKDERPTNGSGNEQANGNEPKAIV